MSRVFRRLAASAALLPLVPVALQGQESTRWRSFQELTATVGTTWFEGARVPTVSTPLAGAFTLGMRRDVGPESQAGLLLRVGVSPVRLKEAGDAWQSGSIQTLDAMIHLARHTGRYGPLELALEANGGFTLLTGDKDILPFAELGTVLPGAEAGVAVRRRPGAAAPGRRIVELFARAGAMRLSAATTRPLMSSGWTPRISFGVRVGE